MQYLQQKNATPGDILAKILLQVILQLEQIGANIIGIACDGSATNKKAWGELNISGKLGYINNNIPNPYEIHRKIYFLGDPVHEIKCIRNNLLKVKMAICNDQNVHYKYYENLFKLDSQGAAGKRLVPKLSEAHIHPKLFQKMHVKYATQLFSRSTARGIRIFRQRCKEAI